MLLVPRLQSKAQIQWMRPQAPSACNHLPIITTNLFIRVCKCMNTFRSPCFSRGNVAAATGGRVSSRGGSTVFGG